MQSSKRPLWRFLGYATSLVLLNYKNNQKLLLKTPKQVVSILCKSQNHWKKWPSQFGFHLWWIQIPFLLSSRTETSSPIKLYLNNILWHQVSISRINTAKNISILITFRANSWSEHMHSGKTTVSLLVALWASYFSHYNNIQCKVKRDTWSYAHFSSFSIVSIWVRHFSSVILCISNV